ncbi:oligosaccharide flippase family protein [Mannheimia varigena]|uniref:oligosaccharide flippase family protein n=1 Tax=Mannheimia varigena TaxID=85404 RepID=UPI0015B5E80D|nr:oligosaccharide flippase family protein [Mannheimia varigena]QLD32584.1 oligosaccharide flippase family protein [Mannheimia varigena]
MKAVKDSVIYLIGELASKSIPFLLLPYFSRKLGVEGYGELSYYQTFSALFVIFIGLSQDGAIARYFYFYGKRSLNLVLKTGYLYTVVMGSLILLGCWIFKAEMIAYVAIGAIFQSFLNVQLSVRQCQKQAISYTAIQLMSAIFSAIITVAMMEYFDSELVEKRILAILVSNALVFFIVYLLYAKKTKTKKFSLARHKTALLYLLGFGVPLILHHSSIFVKGQLDRVFIYHKFSEADLGLYAMGAQIAMILAIVIHALNKATLPYFYEALKQKKINVSHIHKWAFYALFTVPIPALVMWLIPENVVVWILGNQFAGTKYYIILFLSSTMLVVPYLILVNYLFFYGKNKLISFCSILSTIFYLVALFALTLTKIEYIPFASIIGAVSIIPILYVMTAKVGKTV